MCNLANRAGSCDRRVIARLSGAERRIRFVDDVDEIAETRPLVRCKLTPFLVGLMSLAESRG